LELPSLRERRQDIASLATTIVKRLGKKFGKEVATVAPPTLELLESYSWPGNIRQLENVIQQAVLLSSGRALLPHHLPSQIRETPFVPVIRQTDAASSLSRHRQLSERDHIQRVLEECGFSRVRAAKTLRVSRVTLYKKMKKYGLLSEREILGLESLAQSKQ
jgi:DNA-binding NtrC family response regulator